MSKRVGLVHYIGLTCERYNVYVSNVLTDQMTGVVAHLELFESSVYFLLCSTRDGETLGIENKNLLQTVRLQTGIFFLYLTVFINGALFANSDIIDIARRLLIY